MNLKSNLIRSIFLGVAISVAGCNNNSIPSLASPTEVNIDDYVQVDPALNKADRNKLYQALEVMASEPIGLDMIIKSGSSRKLTLTIDNDVEISALDFEKNILTFGRGVHQMGHYCHEDESFAPVTLRDFLYHEMFHIVKHGPFKFDPNKLYERENETVKATDDYRRAVTGTCQRVSYGNSNLLGPSQFYPANVRAMPL